MTNIGEPKRILRVEPINVPKEVPEKKKVKEPIKEPARTK